MRARRAVRYDRIFRNQRFRTKMPTAANGKVLLRVRPRGFCAGVVRAVDIVELALEAYGAPVYVHHEIVHNTYVVEQLRRRGAIFVEAIEEVPHGAVLVFSAHGVPPTVRDEAKARAVGGTPWALKTSTAPCGTSSMVFTKIAPRRRNCSTT